MNESNELTPKEKAILEKTSELWNMLVSLPGDHPDDISEFRLYIHRVQDMIMARPTRRQMRIRR